jgi:hypothetical protein
MHESFSEHYDEEEDDNELPYEVFLDNSDTVDLRDSDERTL